MTENMFRFTTLIPLDLQFFAEDGPTEFESAGIISISDNDTPVVRGYYNPDSEISYPENMSNPLIEDLPQEETHDGLELEQETPIQQENLVQQPTAEQPVFNPNDPYFQQLAAQQQNIQAQMQQLMMQQMQQMQQVLPPQQTVQQQIEPQLSEEEQNERLMEKFYENPSEFFKELKQQAIEEARKDFQPIIQERQIQQQVNTLQQKYGQDFLNEVPAMTELVTQLGDAEVERIGLENVYLMARGLSAQKQVQQQPSPEQLLSDPKFVSEYLAKNPEVQQAVLGQYMQSKQQSQPPQVMGNNAGASPVLTPQERPKSISEASKLLRKSWGI